MEFDPQTADRDAEQFCGVRPIVIAKSERIEDVMTLNVSQRLMIANGSHMHGPPSESPPTL